MLAFRNYPSILMRCCAGGIAARCWRGGPIQRSERTMFGFGEDINHRDTDDEGTDCPEYTTHGCGDECPW